MTEMVTYGMTKVGTYGVRGLQASLLLNGTLEMAVPINK